MCPEFFFFFFKGKRIAIKGSTFWGKGNNSKWALSAYFYVADTKGGAFLG